METAADGFDDSGDESLAGRSGRVLSIAGEMSIGDELLNAVQRGIHDPRAFRLTRQLERQEVFVRLNATRIVLFLG